MSDPHPPSVIFVATRAFALTNSRSLLMNSFLKAGWQVVAAVPLEAEAKQLEEQGIIVEEVRFRRGPASPVQDLACLFRLFQIYRKYRPHLVHHFHGKPIILGSLAGLLVPGTKRVNTLTGLGAPFLYGGWTKYLFLWGYRFLASHADRTIFQNSDDLNFFLKEGLVSQDRARLVTSAGVDTERFHPHGKNESAPLQILMTARLLWRKGVREFVETAEIIKKKFPHVRFRLAGDWDVASDAIPKDWLRAAVENGTIEYLGFVSRMETELNQTAIVVLPTYGGEGTPRVLLEAGACGVPVVTTDTPGCREYAAGGTGILVPPRDVTALSEAVLKLIQDGPLRDRMGRQARERSLRDFDTRLIMQKHLEIYQEIGVSLEVRERVHKPIFIVGAPRTGKKMLAEVLARHSEVFVFPYEMNFLWRYGHARHPHDVLSPSMLTPKIKKYIAGKFEGALARSKKKRIVDRTDHNVVRLDYVRAVFPDCRIIHMVREPKAAVASAMKRRAEKRGWRPYFEKASGVPFSDLPYYAACYLWDLVSARFQGRRHRNLWGVRTPLLIREEVKRMSLAEQCALQWSESVRQGLDFRKSFSDKSYLLIRYEDIVHRPVETAKQIFYFLDLDWPEALSSWLRQNISAGSLDKWKTVLSNEDQERLRPVVMDLARRLGYDEQSLAFAGAVKEHE